MWQLMYLAAFSRCISACFFLILWMFSGEDNCITVTAAVGTCNTSPSLFKKVISFSRPSTAFESNALQITGPHEE